MANDPDALFPSGPTTRRGLFSAFGRRWAESLPVPDSLAPRPTGVLPDPFYEEPPDWIEPVLAGENLVEEIKASVDESGLAHLVARAERLPGAGRQARASSSTRISPTG